MKLLEVNVHLYNFFHLWPNIEKVVGMCDTQSPIVCSDSAQNKIESIGHPSILSQASQLFNTWQGRYFDCIHIIKSKKCAIFGSCSLPLRLKSLIFEKKIVTSERVLGNRFSIFFYQFLAHCLYIHEMGILSLSVDNNSDPVKMHLRHRICLIAKSNFLILL